MLIVWKILGIILIITYVAGMIYAITSLDEGKLSFQKDGIIRTRHVLVGLLYLPFTLVGLIIWKFGKLIETCFHHFFKNIQEKMEKKLDRKLWVIKQK